MDWYTWNWVYYILLLHLFYNIESLPMIKSTHEIRRRMLLFDETWLKKIAITDLFQLAATSSDEEVSKQNCKTSSSKQTRGWNEHASTIRYEHLYTTCSNMFNKYTLFNPQIHPPTLPQSQSPPKKSKKNPPIQSPSPGMLHLIDLLRLQAPWRLQAVARPGRHRRRGHPALRVVRGRHRGHCVARHRVGTRRVGLAQPGAVEAWRGWPPNLPPDVAVTVSNFMWIWLDRMFMNDQPWWSTDLERSCMILQALIPS